MIPIIPFGRTAHNSTRLVFGAAAFFDVTQKEADRTMELGLKPASIISTRPASMACHRNAWDPG
jgi:hypothetical protein